jgi:hypothetical protein
MKKRLEVAPPSPKRLGRRGRHTVLPLTGDVVSEVRAALDTCPTLVFRDAAGAESEIRFEEAVTLLLAGRPPSLLTCSRPGTTFDPQSLGPLLGLLGKQVMDAVAIADGSLRVQFADGSVLGVTPATGYEAWHFLYPRPGSPLHGKHAGLSVTGAHGHLI